MNWFSGTIPESITKAKESDCLFLVFVYDKSELSLSFEEKLNDEIISSVLRSHIAIKLENGSRDAMQFAQIYPLILVPSLFFINPKTGVPLEVIGGEIEVGGLSEKIQRLLQSNEIKSDSDVNHVTSETNSTASDQPIIKADEGDPPPATPSGSPSSSSASLEGRVEKAKELLSQRQQQKAKEELEEEKRKELERRRQLQELNLAKKNKDDSERDEIKKHRMKEKEEDRLAREKVKAQIAADREERRKRSALLRGEQEPPSESGCQQPASASNVAVASSSSPSLERDSNGARIKFRFPDNSSELAFFQATSTLGDVRTHLVEKSGFSSSKFKMVGTLPSRTFTEEHLSCTLRDLHLTPSSIIIVKPIVSSVSLSPATGGNFVVSLFWQLLAPLSLLFDYLSGWFGLRSSSPQPDDSSSSSNPPRPPSKRPKLDSNRDPMGDGGYREGGNVHRLRRPRDGHNDNDDDDENNTWNGNSTQQM